MLMRFDPLREFDRISQMLGQVSDAPRRLPMPMDAYRKGDELIIHFDLPGVEPSSIDITAENNGLTVEAERTWQSSDDIEVIVLERPQGKFSRQLYLGEPVDTEHVNASYDNGVLTLTLSMADRAKPSKIPVAAGQSTTES